MNTLNSCDQKIDEKLRLLFLPLTRYTLHIVEGYWRFYIILTQCGGGRGDIFSTAGFCGEEFKDCECHSRRNSNTADCCDMKTDVKTN
jgi:hypothetical protein